MLVHRNLPATPAALPEIVHLRRRLHLVRKRGQLLAHIQNTKAQYNLPAFEKRLAILARTLGRAASYMLVRDTVFSREKFVAA